MSAPGRDRGKACDELVEAPCLNHTRENDAKGVEGQVTGEKGTPADSSGHAHGLDTLHRAESTRAVLALPDTRDRTWSRPAGVSGVVFGTAALGATDALVQ